MAAQNDHNGLAQRMQVSMTETKVWENDPFSSAPLQIGMDVFVETRIGSSTQKIRSQMVGYLRKEYLIITTPRVNGTSIISNEKRAITIRYFLDGSVFGFQSNVMRSIGPPFHLLILSYPKQVEEVSLRKDARIQVVVPIERDGALQDAEAIINLSASGALMQLGDPLEIGSEFLINFNLPNGVRIENMKCIVRRMEMTTQRILAGVQFVDEHPQRDDIKNYIGLFIETTSNGK